MNNVGGSGEGCRHSMQSKICIYHFIVGPPYLRFLVSADSTNHASCSTLVFTTEINLQISGPAEFKPMSFKGQLYSEKNEDVSKEQRSQLSGGNHGKHESIKINKDSKEF